RLPPPPRRIDRGLVLAYQVPPPGDGLSPCYVVSRGYSLAFGLLNGWEGKKEPFASIYSNLDILYSISRLETKGTSLVRSPRSLKPRQAHINHAANEMLQAYDLTAIPRSAVALNHFYLLARIARYFNAAQFIKVQLKLVEYALTYS